jgi:hypothetical protein
MDTSLSTPQDISQYGENLILRRSTPADAEKLGEFNGRIHGDNELDAQRVNIWTRDLLRGNHPTFAVDDFMIVENTKTNEIVSSLNLISQTWSYAGIPIKVGRPELVGTDPAFRNRGLVRLQFDVVHEWSKQRGEILQSITGIPYYYRLYGYEMTVDLHGGYSGYSLQLPVLKEGASEPCRIRPVEEKDIAFITLLYHQSCQRVLLSTVRSEEDFRYEIFGKSAENVNRLEYRIIESTTGEPLGFLAHPFFPWVEGKRMVASAFELKAGTSWVEITPAVLRYLWQTGKTLAAAQNKEIASFGLRLHRDHPAYAAVAECLPQYNKPYAWYIRVPDLPGFLRLVAPVLENRLVNSSFTGYNGEVKFNFFRSGMRVVFEHGKMSTIESWQPTPKEWGNFSFPNHTFLHLLFGHRTYEEVAHLYPDCWADENVRPLLDILFPKQVSWVLPID